MQSNFGVVTKMGLWLHPVPEEVITVRVALAAKTNTPDLYEILHTLGAPRVADRLARARAWVRTQPG